MQQKDPKSWAKMVPRSPQEPKVEPNRSKNTSKIDPGRGQERVPKPFWHKNVTMSSKPIIYYIKATSQYLKKSLFAMILKSKTV